MKIKAMKPYNGEYRTISRWIKVRYTATSPGHAYFIFMGRRRRIDDFLRLDYPIMWEDKDGKLQHISAYDGTAWWNPELIEIDDSGEYVRVWEEVLEDDKR